MSILNPRSKEFRALVLGILTIMFVYNMYYGYTSVYQSATTPKSKSKPIKHLEPEDYHFSNTTLAMKILTKLDSSYTNKPLNNDNYCLNSLEYLVTNFKTVFDSMKFWTDSYYHTERFPARGVIDKIGTLIQTAQSPKHDQQSKDPYTFREDITYFWYIQKTHEVPEEVVCSHQLHNHIKGKGMLVDKGHIVSLYKEFNNFNMKHRPQCRLNFMPESYALNVKEECEEFFNILNAETYAARKAEHPILFMEKISAGSMAHHAAGVVPFDDEHEKRLIKNFENGKQCGNRMDNLVLQAYIPNPLLFYGYKFDVRVHVLIASTNPLIVYYHDGPFRISLHKFDPNSSSMEVHMANLREDTPPGMSEKEANFLRALDMDDLATYLWEEEYIESKDWLDTGFRYQMKKAIVHLLNATEYGFAVNSNTYEILGCDFLLDTSLNTWFIECSHDTGLGNMEVAHGHMMKKMLEDHWEIMRGYLRSRMKRIMYFVNDIIEEAQQYLPADVGVDKILQRKQEEWNRINKNFFEDEFTPKITNGWSKIIDAGYTGVERYCNLFEQECV
jgi:hypothetical protein